MSGFTLRTFDLTSGSQELGIDSEIHQCGLQAFWTPAKARAFGRAALKVALDDAIRWQDRRAIDLYNQWKRTTELSTAAHKALDDLVNHIPPKGIPLGFTVDEPGGSLKMKLQIIKRGGRSGKSFSREDALKEVKELTGARDTLRKLRDYAEVAPG